jgi:hypothetical protein
MSSRYEIDDDDEHEHEHEQDDSTVPEAGGSNLHQVDPCCRLYGA